MKIKNCIKFKLNYKVYFAFALIILSTNVRASNISLKDSSYRCLILYAEKIVMPEQLIRIGFISTKKNAFDTIFCDYNLGLLTVKVPQHQTDSVNFLKELISSEFILELTTPDTDHKNRIIKLPDLSILFSKYKYLIVSINEHKKKIKRKKSYMVSVTTNFVSNKYDLVGQ